MTIDTTHYEILMSSCPEPDGMLLELWDRASSEQIAEVLYLEDSADMLVSIYRKDVPLSLIEHFLAEAKRRLPPI